MARSAVHRTWERGTVGLSTAVFLTHHGVAPMVVERHDGTAIHPRAGHFHLRTLELLRSVGLEEEVRRMSAEHFGLRALLDAAWRGAPPG
jgi:2-polyprenyl-6-methoxyphenol hydroxylase-like FAD-dependent oxidoreductase